MELSSLADEERLYLLHLVAMTKCLIISGLQEGGVELKGMHPIMPGKTCGKVQRLTSHVTSAAISHRTGSGTGL